MKSQSDFESLYNRARALTETNHKEALKIFQEAKAKYNPETNELYRLTDLIIDESRIFRNKKEFLLASKELEKSLHQIKKIANSYTFEEKIEYLEQEFKLLSELVLLLAEEAEQLEQIPETTDMFIKSIDKSIGYASNAMRICIKILTKQNEIELEEKELSLWESYYSESIINIINPLFVEANRFDNILICKIIENLSTKIQRFYELSSKSSKTAEQTSRSWFYKGSMLSKTSGEIKEAEEYLLKDYRYCENKKNKNNYLINDYEIIRNTLINFYIKKEMLNCVKKYLHNNEEKIYFNTILKLHEEIKELESQIKNKEFLSLPIEKQMNMIEKHIKIIQKDNLQWWVRFPLISKPIIPQVHNKELKYLLTYTTSLSYFELFDEINAISFIEQAIKICKNNINQYYEALYLKLQIYENSENFYYTKEIHHLEKEVLSLAESFGEEEERMFHIQQIQMHIQERNLAKSRQQLLLSILSETPEEKQLFSKMQAKNAQNEPNTLHQFMNPMIKPSTNTLMRSKMPIKTRSELLEESYILKCSEKKVVIREEILGLIKDLKEEELIIDLNRLFNIEEEELIIIIELINNIEYDLRNFHINNSILEKIEKKDIKYVKCVKIKNLHKLITMENYNMVFRKMEELEEVHIEKVDKKFLVKSHNNGSDNNNSVEYCNICLPIMIPNKIKVLKLKQCKINDTIVCKISENYNMLEQLDLSMNEIYGNTLNVLGEIRNLGKLNLSYNPIQNFNCLWNENLQKLKIKCLRCSNSQNSYGMEKLAIGQIRTLSILDISENTTETILNIIKSCYDNLIDMGVFKLGYMREFRMKKCNVNKELFEELNAFFIFFNNNVKIDIRFSYYEENMFKNFEEYQINSMKFFNFDHRAKVSQMYM